MNEHFMNQVVVGDNDNDLYSDINITENNSETEYQKNKDLGALGKKNKHLKLSLKQNHFNNKPIITHRRINMGKR